MSIHRHPDGLSRVPMIAKHRGSVAFQMILAIAEAGEAQAFAMRAEPAVCLTNRTSRMIALKKGMDLPIFPEKRQDFPSPIASSE